MDEDEDVIVLLEVQEFEVTAVPVPQYQVALAQQEFVIPAAE